jgi:hypothetical protein
METAFPKSKSENKTISNHLCLYGAQINNFSQTLQKHRTQQRYDVAGYLQVLRYDGQCSIPWCIK